MARFLHGQYPQRRVPTRTLPDWLIRAAASVLPMLNPIVAELGEAKAIDSTEAIELLGRPFVPADNAILATAETLIAHKLV